MSWFLNRAAAAAIVVVVSMFQELFFSHCLCLFCSFLNNTEIPSKCCLLCLCMSMCEITQCAFWSRTMMTMMMLALSYFSQIVAEILRSFIVDVIIVD